MNKYDFTEFCLHKLKIHFFKIGKDVSRKSTMLRVHVSVVKACNMYLFKTTCCITFTIHFLTHYKFH